jgi:integrase
MCEDAITDEIADVNFVRGVRVRANHPRVRGATRPPRVFGFDELRRFAAHGGEREPMLRVVIDCGLRLGEVRGLARRDFDGDALHLRGSAHAGVFTPGDPGVPAVVRPDRPLGRLDLNPAARREAAWRPTLLAHDVEVGR